MALFGMYGIHTVESCPLFNSKSRGAVLDGRAILDDADALKSKYKINRIIGQYHSALEHTFLWVVDADDPHLLQQAAIESHLASYNAVRIVPLSNYSDVVAKCEKLDS